MNKVKLLTLSLSTIFIIGLSSCGSGNKEEGTDNSQEFDAAAEEKDLAQSIEEVVYDIPSPSEVPYLLQATGAEFNGSLVNGVTKADSYTSSNDKAALNLGIYASDVGYLISHEKVQDALNYMSVSKGLAVQLGLAGQFEQNLVHRFEANLSNPDSLTHLLDHTINNSSEYLKGDGRSKIAALLITGSFIEGLYISSQLIKNYPKDILDEESRNAILTPLIRVILQQEQSAVEVLRMLNDMEKSDTVNDLIEQITTLNQTYAKLNIEEKIRNNQGNLVFDDVTLAEITSIVNNMRTKITD